MNSGISFKERYGFILAYNKKRNVKYKCPYCDKRYTRENLVRHIDDKHNEMIPEGYTAFRVVFNYVNKKPADYNGKCTECGGPTGWDENKGRYNRQCSNPACKASYIKKFEDNMVRVTGSKRVSASAEGLEKMLAGRRISGKYRFQNGTEKTYTGSYERARLEFMDKVMNINPEDIMSPGPVLEYMYNNEKHLYITDSYYIPYNLIIEDKDGGNRPNMRNMPEYRAKQIAKEEYIINHTNYNYLRLTDADMSQLLSAFMDLKFQMIENTGERVIHINEAMTAIMYGGVVGKGNNTFVMNYKQNNVFNDEEDEGIAIADNYELENLVRRNKEGKLVKSSRKFLEHCIYNVYMVDIPIEEVSKKLSPYIGEFVEEGFIYETLFGKKMYTYDQIALEESAIPVVDYYKYMDSFSEITRNFLLGKPKDNYILIEEDTNYSLSKSLESGKYRLESKKDPDLAIESDHYMNLSSIEKQILEYLLIGRIING